MRWFLLGLVTGGWSPGKYTRLSLVNTPNTLLSLVQIPGDIGDGSVTSSRDPEADITPATDITPGPSPLGRPLVSAASDVTPSLVSANTGYIAEPTRHVGLQVKIFSLPTKTLLILTQ